MKRKMKKLADLKTDKVGIDVTAINLDVINNDVLALQGNSDGHFCAFNMQSEEKGNTPVYENDINGEVTCIEPFQAANAIFLGSNRGVVSIYDPVQNKSIFSLQRHLTQITDISPYNNTTRFFASASLDTTIRIWDISCKEEVALFKDHTQQIGRIAITPDNFEMVSCGNDGYVNIWDLRTM